MRNLFFKDKNHWNDIFVSLSSFFVPGELINLAMYCERIRRRFWPEWFVDLEDFSYDDVTDRSDSKLPDLGLYSRTDSSRDTLSRTPHTSHTPTPQEPPSPVSDPTGHSLYDSDMDTECSEIDALKCWRKTHFLHTPLQRGELCSSFSSSLHPPFCEQETAGDCG